MLKEKIRNAVLSAASSSFINKGDINFDQNIEGLQYFFEPNAGSVQEYSPEWLGHTSVNTINDDTLNETKDYSTEKPKDAYRIVTIGDSFVFGHFVDTADNWTEVLERALNRSVSCEGVSNFEVINLGQFGYDASYMVARYFKRGEKYAPDTIVWLLNPWNLENISEYYLPLVKKLEQGKNNSGEGDLDMVAVVDVALANLKQKYGDQVGMRFHRPFLDKFFSEVDAEVLLFNTHTYQKAQEEYLNNFLAKDPQRYRSKFLVNLEKAPGLKFEDGHPNQEGHQKLAEEVLQELLGKELKTCVIN